MYKIEAYTSEDPIEDLQVEDNCITFIFYLEEIILDASFPSATGL